jgi:hypothetical protein
MNTDNDYDEDGNNIVPCPICLNVYCPSNDYDRNGNKLGDGRCPKEDEFMNDLLSNKK